jgi:hypothetical protein
MVHLVLDFSALLSHAPDVGAHMAVVIFDAPRSTASHA